MPFPRQTLTALRTQAMQDITASDLPNADGFLRRSVLRVLAWAQAGMAYLHYGYLDWIARQATPFNATDEYLEAWSALAPTPVLRQAAAKAIGSATFVATGTGTTIPSGTVMARSDNVQFITTADATISGGFCTPSIIAVAGGSAGNSDAGTGLTLASTVTGVTPTGTAVGPITGGTDLELDPSMRTRMLESYAAPPHGGNASDYETWAFEVAGVTRVWVKPVPIAPGAVSIFFMKDVANVGSGGFPVGTNGVATLETRDTAATGDQLAVANHIFPLRPVTALVYAVAPANQVQNFTTTGLSGISAAQKTLVSNALKSMFLRLDSPLQDTSINQSDVDAAISAISGLPSFAVTSPSVWPITSAFGSIFTLGSVTYS